jgi:hypothetical protein
MTPQSAVIDLVAAGWTEARIAAAVSTTQPTINRIKRGGQRTCNFELGQALTELAAKHVTPSKRRVA